MEELVNNVMYETSSEKELIKMWEDIKGSNVKSSNRTLMKEIAKNNEDPRFIGEVGEPEIPLYLKEMWDSEKGEWVPFDLWGAHFIVNERKEYVILRIFRPVAIQPEFGPTLMGWHSLDSSYLNDKLKEKTNPYEQISMFQSFSGRQDFYEIIKQDHQEYRNEGRIQELAMKYDENVGF